MKTFIKILAMLFIIFMIASQKTNSQSNFHSTKFIDQYNGIIAADAGMIEYTSDQGATWTSVNTGFPNNLNGIIWFTTSNSQANLASSVTFTLNDLSFL